VGLRFNVYPGLETANIHGWCANATCSRTALSSPTPLAFISPPEQPTSSEVNCETRETISPLGLDSADPKKKTNSPPGVLDCSVIVSVHKAIV